MMPNCPAQAGGERRIFNFFESAPIKAFASPLKKASSFLFLPEIQKPEIWL
jgi:hypothetical protein